jgi:hypothetical protein
MPRGEGVRVPWRVLWAFYSPGEAANHGGTEARPAGQPGPLGCGEQPLQEGANAPEAEHASHGQHRTGSGAIILHGTEADGQRPNLTILRGLRLPERGYLIPRGEPRYCGEDLLHVGLHLRQGFPLVLDL